MNQATDSIALAECKSSPFDDGCAICMLRLWGSSDPGNPRVWRLAVGVVLVGWLPLFVLALVPLAGGNDEVLRAFLRDASVHARSRVAAPIFVLAEGVCGPRLAALARTFRERGIILQGRDSAYDEVVRSISRLRDLWPVHVLAVVLAYVIAILLFAYVPASFLPDWHHSQQILLLGRSLASWWHALVSLPLLLILLLGWCWRLVLWARYLWLVSRMDLRLVASHPEGAAGLMFLSHSLSDLSVLGAAIGVIVASTELAHLFAGGAVTLEQLGRVTFGTIVFVLLIFVAPLLSFSDVLARTRLLGVSTYGALAQRVGEAMEDKWMRGRAGADTSDPLSSTDFSVVSDLFQSAQRASTMRLMPIESGSLLVLTGATALPFGAVALTLVPFSKLLEGLIHLFL